MLSIPLVNVVLVDNRMFYLMEEVSTVRNYFVDSTDVVNECITHCVLMEIHKASLEKVEKEIQALKKLSTSGETITTCTLLVKQNSSEGPLKGHSLRPLGRTGGRIERANRSI